MDIIHYCTTINDTLLNNFNFTVIQYLTYSTLIMQHNLGLGLGFGFGLGLGFMSCIRFIYICIIFIFLRVFRVEKKILITHTIKLSIVSTYVFN